MSVYMLDYVHNQLYKEPDAGKPHVRIRRGGWGVIPTSTRQEQGIELAGAVHDFNYPKENGQGYMFFTIRRL